jgi:hypothetical protein
MNKFEQILRKNIQAVTLDTVQRQTDQVERFPADKFPCNVPGTAVLDVNAVCTAVNQLSSTAGNPGNNKCAKLIKKYNTTACNNREYIKADTVIRKCDDYVNSVTSALSNNATDAKRAEARRKAKCDCLNFALVGRPVLNYTDLTAGVMKKQIEDFDNAYCSYTYLARVCAERSKVSDALNAISPACPVPP